MPVRSFKPRIFMTLAALTVFLAGCGEWRNEDPLAFIGPGPPGQKTNQIDSEPPPDPLGNLPPIEMKQGGMLGSLGFNYETYFAPDIQDPIERIKRLERAVIAMQKDVRVMAPATQRLADLEPEIKTAVMVTQPAQMMAPETNAPANLVGAMEEQAAPMATPTPAENPVNQGPRAVETAGNVPVVTGVRVGEHPDMVRVVFDVTKKTGYRADLDNNENLLVVELPDAKWLTPTNFESFKGMPVLKSYKVDPFNNGQGQIFILQLTGPTEIIAQGKYPPVSGGEGERIVIDLRK